MDKRPRTASSAFGWYLGSASVWMAGMSLQGFLFSWMLVGILEAPADAVGLARMLAEFPPLLILLLGGVLVDRVDGRRLLLIMQLAMVLPPVLLATLAGANRLDYASVVLFGVVLASIQALTDPARQAILNQVTALDTQRAVTLTAIVTTLVGMAGFWLGGQLETLGLPLLLLLQAGLFLLGAPVTARLPALPPAASPERLRLTAGLRAIRSSPLLRDVVALNVMSSLFNAGAYIVVLPFIVKTVYGGSAELFATVLLAFTAGSVGSNLVLLGAMPLQRPVRLLLLMQPTRAVLLLALLFEPPQWLFLLLLFGWGLNTGVTSTLVRTTVQEQAPDATRAQILSILQFSFMIAVPISSALLGLLVAATTPTVGLWPGVAVSLALFAYGFSRPVLRDYLAPAAPRPSPDR
ncbi:MAG: MFS transporter [Gammaproteobacteria bacterium]